jgi:hypothetical protein
LEGVFASGLLIWEQRFLTLSAAFARGLFAQIGLFAHLIARLAPVIGITASRAAVSVATLCAVVGRIAMGHSMLIRFFPMKLDPTQSVAADIYYGEDGKPWIGLTWPSADGIAIILCPECGEIDEEGKFFEPNTVYSNLRVPGGNESDGTHLGCQVCKSNGFLFVGL